MRVRQSISQQIVAMRNHAQECEWGYELYNHPPGMLAECWNHKFHKFDLDSDWICEHCWTHHAPHRDKEHYQECPERDWQGCHRTSLNGEHCRGKTNFVTGEHKGSKCAGKGW